MFNRGFEVKDLNDFNGPLDLLVHLISKKEIEIVDVNLTEITNQYLAYIEEVKKQSIEIASEYLSMAAYLIRLKSAFLIPKTKEEVDDNWEDVQRKEFFDRLVEYHKIKEVTKYFVDRQKDTTKLISKQKSILKVTRIDDDKLPLAKNTINIEKFSKIFLNVIAKQKRSTQGEKNLKIVEISPDVVVGEIRKFLEKEEKIWINLEALIENENFSIGMLVVVFVSILDLAKEQYLQIKQDNDDIFVRRK
ncbi:segregation and condensation protein A [Spiroplasma endosymbiont of Aspidapion aeneum]|uniref:segregation and condensation protein A n=1 Tax=Spiroplasma endosymbiont of Aspidapion aeneum TaxID=3066276 RepID=UPI00313F019E